MMSHSKYIIGVDSGSQSTKVVIYDLLGNPISEGQQKLKPMDMPHPGIVEHPDDDLWESFIKASKQALKEFPGRLEDIIGLGLCTIRFCRCLLKEDGSLASPVMSWMDARVSKPYHHELSTVAYVTTSSGYITHRLTGEFKDTAANYKGMWPIDSEEWDWSTEAAAYESTNLPRKMLFELIKPGETLGYITKEAAAITGIPMNLPVIATANDKAVEALGAGLMKDETALISLGTYIAGMVSSTENVHNTPHSWTNFASIPNQYLLESNGIRRGMWTVSWFVDLFGQGLIDQAKEMGITPEQLLNEEASKQVEPGSAGLITILDWLAPDEIPFRKGMMIGLDERHNRAHLYHSILEAIALEMKNHLDALSLEQNRTIKDVIVSGGGSNSNLIMQIIADVFGVKTKRNLVNGSASLGAAINVAVGLREYQTYEEAVSNMVATKDFFVPNEETSQFYQEFNREIYSQVRIHTDKLLKKMNRMSL